MIISKTVITGIEEPKTSERLPEHALNDFYRAFNSCDLDLMKENWLEGTESSMSNPLGGLKRGWPSIKEVYQRIFNGPAQVYVEFYDYTIHHTDNMFVAVGRERGYFRLDDNSIELQIRTSRTYRLVSGYWKQIHHHGSIDDSGLLQRYQSGVRAAQQSR